MHYRPIAKQITNHSSISPMIIMTLFYSTQCKKHIIGQDIETDAPHARKNSLQKTNAAVKLSNTTTKSGSCWPPFLQHASTGIYYYITIRLVAAWPTAAARRNLVLLWICGCVDCRGGKDVNDRTRQSDSAGEDVGNHQDDEPRRQQEQPTGQEATD